MAKLMKINTLVGADWLSNDTLLFIVWKLPLGASQFRFIVPEGCISGKCNVCVLSEQCDADLLLDG